MAGITLAQAEAKLTTFMTALDAIASGQSYSIAGRSLSRANLADVQAQVEFWDTKVKRLSKAGGGIPVKGVTPV